MTWLQQNYTWFKQNQYFPRETEGSIQFLAVIGINPQRHWSQLSHYKRLKKWPSFIEETQTFLSGAFFSYSCVWETTVLRATLGAQRGSQHKAHSHPLMGTTAAGLKNWVRWICSTFSSASRALTGISKSAPTKLPAWLVEPQRALSNFKRLNLEQDDRQSPLQHRECVHPSSNPQPSHGPDGSNSHFCLQREQFLFIFKLPVCVTLYEKL